MLTFSAPLLLLAGAQAASANLFNDDARVALMSSEVEGTRNLGGVEPFMKENVPIYVALATDTVSICAAVAAGLTFFTPNSKGGKIFFGLEIISGIAASSLSIVYLVNLLLLVLKAATGKYPLVVVAIVINASTIVLYALTSAGYLAKPKYAWGVKLASFLAQIAGYSLFKLLSYNDVMKLAKEIHPSS